VRTETVSQYQSAEIISVILIIVSAVLFALALSWSVLGLTLV